MSAYVMWLLCGLLSELLQNVWNFWVCVCVWKIAIVLAICDTLHIQKHSGNHIFCIYFIWTQQFKLHQNAPRRCNQMVAAAMWPCVESNIKWLYSYAAYVNRNTHYLVFMRVLVCVSKPAIDHKFPLILLI